MSGLLGLGLGALLLAAAQGFVAGLPSEMKTVLKAEIWTDGATIYIENRTDAPWQICWVRLNDHYERAYDRIPAGGVAAFSADSFASPNGVAFSPSVEPLYDVFINCLRAPTGRGIALYLAADREHKMVVEAQERLALKGYSPGPADGMLGPQTQAAIRAFQEASGQEPTGRVDNTLLDSLRERVSRQ